MNERKRKREFIECACVYTESREKKEELRERREEYNKNN